MKKRLFLIITMCVVLDWYMKNNMIHQKSDKSTHSGQSVASQILASKKI
ncbi:MAG: hypothetical protein WC707_02075 [Candidatus Babeliaceae bacterium]|jgi:hypothetical protein